MMSTKFVFNVHVEDDLSCKFSASHALITHPAVTVAVLNYNNMEYLGRCLESLRNEACQDYEVILVDNASTDDSVEYVRANFPWVKIIANRENLGYAKANNKVARIAVGEYLFFLNADTWLEPNTIRELIRAAEINREVAAFAPTIMDYAGKIKLSLGVGCDIFGYPCPDFTEKTFYVDGASVFIRKRVFHQVGGFDDRYFVFGEDLDLAWRLRLQGHRIATVAMSRVYHKSGGTVIGGAIRGTKYTTTLWRRYLGERNEICTLLKNYGLLTLSVIVPLYLMINVAEMLVFLMKGKMEVVDIYLRAWLWNIKNLKRTLGWRREIQRNRKVSDREIMKYMYKRPLKIDVFRRVGLPEFTGSIPFERASE